MFKIVIIKSIVEVKPDDFSQDEEEYILNYLNSKFCDQVKYYLLKKVIHNVGLFMCVFEIIDVNLPFVFPGEGSYYTHVQFSAVVFKPFEKEVLEGTVKTITRTQIQSIFIFKSFV